MKVIDLLNKIANGEEVPKKIKYNGIEMYFCKPCKIYEVYSDNELCGKDLYNILDNLNDKVEIIEEEKKMPEKLGVINYCEDQATSLIHHKVDEIIDYLDYLKSKGDSNE